MSDDNVQVQDAPVAPDVRRGGAGPLGWFAITVGLVGAGWIVMDMVCRQTPPPAPPPRAVWARLRLVRMPAWMSPDIRKEIFQDIRKVSRGRAISDEGLARDLYHAAAANPWIERVRRVVKYQDGVVVVDAQYRRPFAVAASAAGNGELYVVDREGVVLPLPPDRLDGRALVVIRDVAARPVSVGEKWDAPDLRDGLRLLDLIKDKPYLREITTIDIRNWSEVIPTEPRIRLRAERPDGSYTDVRFGRFPVADGLDYCITPERKIEYLDAYYRSNGNRLAGANAFVDLQYDKLYVSHDAMR